jgi:integrase
MIAPSGRMICVRKSVWNGKKQEPKTENAVRDFDIAAPLAKMLKEYVGDRTSGFLFASDSGKPLLQRNNSGDSLEKLMFGQELQNSQGKVIASVPAAVEGKKDGWGFHSFRRFRITHLRTKGCPEDILRFWVGHADKSMTDRYSQMKLRVDLRRETAEKIGLGFDILKGGK